MELSDVIVVHDDLDLPFETIRMKEGGGHGGHRGLMSIQDHFGDSGFMRVRLGIGRPCEQMAPEHYVLQPFSSEEEKILPGVLERVCGAIKIMITEDIQKAMSQYHNRSAIKN